MTASSTSWSAATGWTSTWEAGAATRPSCWPQLTRRSTSTGCSWIPTGPTRTWGTTAASWQTTTWSWKKRTRILSTAVLGSRWMRARAKKFDERPKEVRLFFEILFGTRFGQLTRDPSLRRPRLSAPDLCSTFSLRPLAGSAESRCLLVAPNQLKKA